ncbi:MAG: DNA polymerase, partial [bacterium]|nr:DNA polymerase [bacterium]
DSYNLRISRSDIKEIVINDMNKLMNLEFKDEVSLYFTTSSTDYINSQLVGVYFAVDNCVYYINDKAIIEKFLNLIKNKKILGHNIKKEIFLAKKFFNVELRNICFDTYIAGWILDPSKKIFSLKDFVVKEFGITHENEGLLIKFIPELADKYASEISKKGLEKAYYTNELPLIEVVASMEYHGVYVDRNILEKIGMEFLKSMEELKLKIYKIVGYEFNINSTKQLRDVLFGKLMLKPIKKTKTGYSTDEEVLIKLQTQHEVPKLILEYRELSKLYNTYVEGLLKLINPSTNRIHAKFNQAGTETGRFSSSDPNLQNIPARGIGLKIREAFRSQNGFMILKADYSQIEPRLLAHFSGDRKLIEFFITGGDFHLYTANVLFGKMDEVTRRMAKAINFGIMYGMQPATLAEFLGVDFYTAKKFIDSYYENFPYVGIWKEEVINFARLNGYVETILGRRRYIPHINSPNLKERAHAERIAVNTILQGSAADIVKYAMIKLYNSFREKKLKARILIQVHDELVFEAPIDELDLVKEILSENMPFEGLKVPLTFDVKIAEHWL